MDSFLSQHTRQAKMYIDLPSGGKFYNDSIIKDSQFVQIPVFGMTAMDEITLKTPDALFSGLATANIIKSCIPTILDPFQLVRYDIEYILLAIRIASEGDKYDLESSCPKCGHENGLEVDLSKILGNYDSMPIDHTFFIDALQYNLTPIRYNLVTQLGLQTYQIQRKIFQIRTSETLSEDEKQNLVGNEIKELATLNNKATIAYIDSISDTENTENNPEVISNYILTHEKAVANKIVSEVRDYVKNWELPSLPITCQNSECNNDYETVLNVDYSNFFDKLSLITRNLSS